MGREGLGFNQSDIIDNNRTVLLRLLCRAGVCPRVELARQTGLKQSTITNITAEFIRWGLVQETGFLTGSKGRRYSEHTSCTDAFCNQHLQSLSDPAVNPAI